MLITEFQTHLSNSGVKHAYRYADLESDVFKNPKNNKFIRINIAENFIPDLAAFTFCVHLEIDNPVDTDYIKNLLAEQSHGDAD